MFIMNFTNLFTHFVNNNKNMKLQLCRQPPLQQISTLQMLHFARSPSRKNNHKLLIIYGKQRKIGYQIIHTKDAEIVKRTNVHLHAPDGKTAICCGVKTRIKRKAIDSQDSSHQIVGKSLQTISEGVAAKLPKLDSLKRSIQRYRVRHLAAPVQPTTLEHLNLPEEY